MVDVEALVIGGTVMTLRDVTPADMSEVLGLHQRVFGTSADETWFNWKYSQGGGEGVGAWHDGRLVAHCGGFPRHILHGGLRQHDLQIGDVMVAPEWRGILTRHGPFFHVSKRLYESRLGKGNRFYAGFGFPNARALRLGMRTGLSWDTGQILALRWDAASRTARGADVDLSRFLWHVSHLDPASDAFDLAVDDAWAHMLTSAKDLVLPERSAAYVRWRFAMQPDSDTIFLQLRRPWQKSVTGVAVLSKPSPSQPWMHWLDWIGPPDLMAVACAMCRTEAACTEGVGLMAWASKSVLSQLAETGISSQSETARISIAAASAIQKDEAHQLNWWLMGGDTDFL